jgi:type VI protein secretion system component Hcp
MRVSLAALACAALFAGLPTPASAAIYMKIKDIPGEATHKDHQAWIDIQNWSFGPGHMGVGGRLSGPTDCAGEAGPGLVLLRRAADKASPLLQRSAKDGVSVGDVVVEAPGPAGAAYRYELKDVVISNFDPAGGAPTESLALNYAQVVWRNLSCAGR